MRRPSLLDSPTADRMRMLRSLPRLAVSRNGTCRALARALATTALGRVPSEEREWIERIQARRRRLACEQRITHPVFYPGPRLPESWAEIFGPLAISRAAREVSVPSRWGVFLMRLVRELSPRSCVELGTGFGISAAYQAASLQLNGAGGLITLDAAGEWAEIAEQGFSELGLERVEIEVGELNDTLEDAVTRAAPVDYAFVDAEHQELATHRHFETLLPHLSDGAVVAFDDIIFPEEMMRAWKAISRHARVAVAIGLGRIGVVVISGGDS